MRQWAGAALLVMLSAPALAQDVGEVQRHFEAGRYQQVVDALTPESPPLVVYLAAQSYQKLGAAPQAIETYQRLADRPPEDAWALIGQSGRQLAEEQPDAAIASGREAVAQVAPRETAPAPPDVTLAHYQLGLALARQEQWAEAAGQFDRAAELTPDFAYAQYYAGLMHYQANRPDRMGVRFDRFLKLAPEAPEAPQVQSIMRTLRRR